MLANAQPPVKNSLGCWRNLLMLCGPVVVMTILLVLDLLPAWRIDLGSSVRSDISYRDLLPESWNMVALYRGNATDPALQASPWNSQVGQDQTIASIFDGKRGGYFVDLAANDAVSISNTLALEQTFGWTGLCIEPNPMYMKGYLHRTCQLVQSVVGPVENEAVDFRFDNAAYGGVVGDEFDNHEKGLPMYTVSVGKILHDFKAPRQIDYLSLDIEGAEAWAFKTFPWVSYTFLTLTVERPKPELVKMLKQNGYVYLCDHAGFGDQFWVHPAVPNFGQVVAKYQGQSNCQDATAAG